MHTWPCGSCACAFIGFFMRLYKRILQSFPGVYTHATHAIQRSSPKAHVAVTRRKKDMQSRGRMKFGGFACEFHVYLHVIDIQLGKTTGVLRQNNFLMMIESKSCMQPRRVRACVYWQSRTSRIALTAAKRKLRNRFLCACCRQNGDGK